MISLFLELRTSGSSRLGNLPKETRRARGGGWFQAQMSGSAKPGSLPPTQTAPCSCETVGQALPVPPLPIPVNWPNNGILFQS